MFKGIRVKGGKVVKNFIHYKFNRGIKLTELLSELCLTRSDLNIEISNYHNRVDKLSIIYNSVVLDRIIEQDSIDALMKLQDRIIETSDRVDQLLSKNSIITNSILKLNKEDYVKNSDIEKGLFLTIKKAKITNIKFDDLSVRISNLNSLETP